MTAGKGIVHSERTPNYLRQSEKRMHGLQIWVALPKHLEQMNPEFVHIDEGQIPKWEHEGAQFKLIAGEAWERKSPVPVYSKLYMIEIQCSNHQKISIGQHLYGEAGLYILEGGIETEGQLFEPGQLLVATQSTLGEFTLQPNSRV